MNRPEDCSWSLIGRAAAGDRTARSAFSRGYLPVVRSFLEGRWRGTCLASEVDDAVQEVFVECLRENGVLSRADPKRGDLRGLLYGVTQNVAARCEKRLDRLTSGRHETDSILETIRAREPSLSRLFDSTWAKTLLHLAGDRLRAEAEGGTEEARQRVELLRLRFGEGMPIRDIAATWNADADALHRAYARVRDEFRVCLRRVVAEHCVRSEDDLDAEVSRILRLLD